jgi:hypothetical protein
MTGFQFIHLNGYGVKAGRGRDPWNNIDGTIAEAMRKPGNMPHIDHPCEPNILFGVNPYMVGAAAMVLSRQAKDRKGNRLRCDGVVLLAGVVTYPQPRADLHDPIERNIYEKWKTEVVEWLVERSEIDIQSVVEHLEEEHMNLHFFALPTLMPDSRLNFDRVHPGRKARDAAAAKEGATPASIQAAYVNEMSAWQDRFFRDVSMQFGHARLGPQRDRVKRERHKALKQNRLELEIGRAGMLLDFLIARSPDEFAALSRTVDQKILTAVAADKIRKLQQELAWKDDLLRDAGFVDPDEFPLPPDPNSVTFPSVSPSATLAALAKLNEGSEAAATQAPALERNREHHQEWYKRQIAIADSLQSSVLGRKADAGPRARDSEPDMEPPEQGTSFRPR